MGKGKMMNGAEESLQETTEEPAAAPKQYVVYKDAMHFDVRSISKADWAKVGVADAPTITWDTANGHRVPLEDFGFLSEDEFSRFILADARLEVVER